MPSEPANDELTKVWQQQELEGGKMSLADVQRNADKFEKSIWWRNFMEYAAAVIVLVGFGRILFTAVDVYGRLGAAMTLAATAFVVYWLHTRASAQTAPPDADLATYLRFYKASLERQRDILRGVWLWYLLPFVPGILFIYISRMVREGILFNPARTPEQTQYGIVILLWLGFTLLFFLAAAWWNRRGARKLQERIAALDRDR